MIDSYTRAQAELFVSRLNALLKQHRDMPGVLQRLIEARIEVSEDVADNTSIITCYNEEDVLELGILGLLNGLLGLDIQSYRVTAVYDDDSGVLLRFEVSNYTGGSADD